MNWPMVMRQQGQGSAPLPYLPDPAPLSSATLGGSEDKQLSNCKPTQGSWPPPPPAYRSLSWPLHSLPRVAVVSSTAILGPLSMRWDPGINYTWASLTSKKDHSSWRQALRHSALSNVPSGSFWGVSWRTSPYVLSPLSWSINLDKPCLRLPLGLLSISIA